MSTQVTSQPGSFSQPQVRVIENDPKLQSVWRGSETVRRRTLAILSPIGMILLWQILSGYHILDTRFFPAPTTIFMSFIGMVKTGIFMKDLEVSGLRIVGGYFLGAIPGLTVGIIMGLSKTIRNIFEPIVAVLYPILRLALLPLIMLIFGVGELEKVIVVADGTFFLVLLNTIGGVVHLDKIYLDVARNFGCKKWDYFRRIAIPGALPSIFSRDSKWV